MMHCLIDLEFTDTSREFDLVENGAPDDKQIVCREVAYRNLIKDSGTNITTVDHALPKLAVSNSRTLSEALGQGKRTIFKKAVIK